MIFKKFADFNWIQSRFSASFSKFSIQSPPDHNKRLSKCDLNLKLSQKLLARHKKLKQKTKFFIFLCEKTHSKIIFISQFIKINHIKFESFEIPFDKLWRNIIYIKIKNKIEKNTFNLNLKAQRKFLNFLRGLVLLAQNFPLRGKMDDLESVEFSLIRRRISAVPRRLLGCECF